MTMTEPARRRRNRSTPAARNNNPTTPSPDAPVTPVAGIVDMQGNRTWIRTRGYVASPDDVRVPPGEVSRSGLRQGDEVTGAAAAGDADRLTLVSLDTV